MGFNSGLKGLNARPEYACNQQCGSTLTIYSTTKCYSSWRNGTTQL